MNLADIAGGLGGHGLAHQQLVWLAVAGLFVIAVVGLIVLHRRMAAAFELEEVERIIDEHEP